MNRWQEARLGDLLTIKHGFAFKGKFFTNDGNLIVLTPGNFREEGGFKHKSGVEKYYFGPVPDRYLLSKDQVIVAMTEQAAGLLGSSARIPVDDVYLHNQRIGLVVADEAVAVLDFLYYLFNAPFVRRQIAATATGAKVRHTAPERIHSVRIQIPDLRSQHRVASVLRAFDELIENNRQRIEILEATARALYREWFVRHRFPGQESGDIDAASAWLECPLREVTLLIKRGIAPKYDDDGSSVILNQRCIRNGRVNLTSAKRQSKKIPSERQILFGDVLVNSTGVGTLGRVAQVYQDLPSTTVDSHVTILRADPALLSIDLFGQAMLNAEAKFAALGIGSTGQTELGGDAIAAQRITLPPLELQSAYGCRVSGSRHLVIQLEEQVRALAAARDLLVPKLVTGQIEVESLGVDDVFGWAELAEESAG